MWVCMHYLVWDEHDTRPHEEVNANGGIYEIMTDPDLVSRDQLYKNRSSGKTDSQKEKRSSGSSIPLENSIRELIFREDLFLYNFLQACIVAIVATLVCLYLRCGYSLLRDRTNTTQLPLWTV